MDNVCVEDKAVETVYLAESVLVVSKPCLLYGLRNTSTLAGGIFVTIYDGFNSLVLPKFRMLARKTRYNKGISFRVPIYFSRGLYIEFSSIYTKVMVKYKILA